MSHVDGTAQALWALLRFSEGRSDQTKQLVEQAGHDPHGVESQYAPGWGLVLAVFLVVRLVLFVLCGLMLLSWPRV